MSSLGGSSFLQALGWAIANSLWQMALLWIVYQCCFLLYRNAKASFKTGTATVLLFAGFLWFVASLTTHYWALEINPLSSGNARAYLGHYARTLASYRGHALLYYVNVALGWAEHYLPYLSFAYLLVLSFLLIRVVKAYRHVLEVRSEGLARIDAQWRVYIQQLAYRIGIRREISVWLSEKIDIPATVGYLKPLILLPIASFNHLTTEQVEAILLHELAHIKRNDYLLNLVITVVETILFFNPFAQLITRHIKTERENSCDDFVLQFRYSPHMYASALLSLEKQRLAPELAMAAAGKTDLLNRIKRILNVPGKSMNYGQKLMALLITACILASLAWLTPEHVANKPLLSGISSLMVQTPSAPALREARVHSPRPKHKVLTDIVIKPDVDSAVVPDVKNDLSLDLAPIDPDDNQAQVTVDQAATARAMADQIKAQKTMNALVQARDQQMKLTLDKHFQLVLDKGVQMRAFRIVTDQLESMKTTRQRTCVLDQRAALRVQQEQLNKKLLQVQSALLQLSTLQQSKVKLLRYATPPVRFSNGVLDLSKWQLTDDSARKIVIRMVKVATDRLERQMPLSMHKATVLDQQPDEGDNGIKADQPDWQTPAVTLPPDQNDASHWTTVPVAYLTPQRSAVGPYHERVLLTKGNTPIHSFLRQLEEDGLLPEGRDVRIVRDDRTLMINDRPVSEAVYGRCMGFLNGRNFVMISSGKVIEVTIR